MGCDVVGRWEGSGLEQGFRGRKHIQLLGRLWGVANQVCIYFANQVCIYICFAGLFSATKWFLLLHQVFLLVCNVCWCVGGGRGVRQEVHSAGPLVCSCCQCGNVDFEQKQYIGTKSFSMLQ